MKKDYPGIEGLRQIYHNEFDRTYYTSYEMILNGVFIEDFMIIEENRDVRSNVTVKCVSKSDTEIYSIYDDSLLSGIETYRILKDIVDIYNDFTLPEFLKIIRELSFSYTSSSMQSKAEHRLDMRANMQDDLAWVISQM